MPSLTVRTITPWPTLLPTRRWTALIGALRSNYLHFEIDIPADKDVFLETGVYDWQTGKAGTLEVALPVEPGAMKAAAQ